MNGEDVDCFAGPAGMVKTKMVDALFVGGARDGHTMRVREGCRSVMILRRGDREDYADEYVRRDDGCYVFAKARAVKEPEW